MNNSNYEYLENLVNIFFEGDEYEKSDALESIIDCFKPLIVKLMLKYFKNFDEDLMQGAIVELIERTISYDYKNYNRFGAYIKTFMKIHFKKIFYGSIKKNELSYDDNINDLSNTDTYDIEMQSLIDTLDYKQKYIIKKNIIENQKLKLIAKEMNISYIYAKKLKQSALKTLKSNLVDI